MIPLLLDSLGNKSKRLRILGNPSMLVFSPILPLIPPIGKVFLISLPRLLLALNIEFSGGCLRNTTDCEDSGIPWRKPCSLGAGTNSIFLKRLLMTCHLIHSLMENYGIECTLRIGTANHSLLGLGGTTFKNQWRLHTGWIMIRSIGIHSDSWCLIFPHPKEPILNDINNYVCFLFPQLNTGFNFLEYQNRASSQREESSLYKDCRIPSVSRNRSSWEDISGYHGSRRRRNHLARSY